MTSLTFTQFYSKFKYTKTQYAHASILNMEFEDSCES